MNLINGRGGMYNRKNDGPCWKGVEEVEKKIDLMDTLLRCMVI